MTDFSTAQSNPTQVPAADPAPTPAQPPSHSAIRAQAIEQLEAGLGQRFQTLKDLMADLRAF